MAAVRWLMLLGLAVGALCFLVHRWTGHTHWRTRGLRWVGGTVGLVMVFATVLWWRSG